MNRFFQIAVVVSGLLYSCAPKGGQQTDKVDSVKTVKDTAVSFAQVDSIVYADVQTQPVDADTVDDAADDPAIWIHPTDRNKSTIIGTNKKKGLGVYSLDGKQMYFYPVGNVNNVDLRYGFVIGKDTVDVVGTTNRTTQTLDLFTVNSKTGELSAANAAPVKSKVDDVYGFCMYKSHKTGKFYAILNGKNGRVEQYELSDNGNQKIDAKLVRTIQVKTQTEGMVADDEMGFLYIGEEEVGVWKYGAEPNTGEQRVFIEMSSPEKNKALAYDIEGVSLYYAANGKGYLLVSSQGNNTYAVFERDGNNKYLFNFGVRTGETIDGSEETDGLDVLNMSLGDKFPNGAFIAQDGFNYEGDKAAPQNFKLVSWGKIAKLSQPQLLIDSDYNIRK